MLEQVLKPLRENGWEAEVVQIGGRDMKGCLACGKCWEMKNMTCIRKDIFNDIFPKMAEADAIVLGSPTYFTDVTAEMKALIDRAGFVALANDRKFKGKVGAAAVAVRRGGGIHVFDTLNHLFLISQMVVPGSTYWNIGYGLDRGDVEKDAEAADNMRNLGEMIHWTASALKQNMDKLPSLESFHG